MRGFHPDNTKYLVSIYNLIRVRLTTYRFFIAKANKYYVEYSKAFYPFYMEYITPDKGKEFYKLIMQ